MAVMDMWQAFQDSTLAKGNAPPAKIVYDRFYIMQNLSRALYQVQRQEYAWLTGPDRRFIKGQRYALLSRWGHLML